MNKKPVILTAVRYYLPGYRSGGPVRSLSNLVEALGEEYDFHIVCLDNDKGVAYPHVDRSGTVHSVGKAYIIYLPMREVTIRRWQSLIRQVRPDAIYLNSLFDFKFSTLPLLANRAGIYSPVLLAPRGELSPGALALKRRKKTIFLDVLRHSGLISPIYWQACSEEEHEDLRREFPIPANHLFHAANIPNTSSLSARTSASKLPGQLRVVFLSRVSPKKNLHSAIAMISQLSGKVNFDIWGPFDDADYANKCRKAAKACPSNITITFRGELPNQSVPEVLADYDVFLLPTLGENFGHAIFEALSAGLPVIVSDRTPWRNLKDAGVGADLALKDKAGFVRELQRYQAMDEESMALARAACHEYVTTWRHRNVDLDAHRRMFNAVIASHRQHAPRGNKEEVIAQRGLENLYSGPQNRTTASFRQ